MGFYDVNYRASSRHRSSVSLGFTPAPIRAPFYISKEKRYALRTFFLWSGLRGSNPPPRPWQGRALPNELNPRMEAPPGIGPGNKGFADLCLTAWLWRRFWNVNIIPRHTFFVNAFFKKYLGNFSDHIDKNTKSVDIYRPTLMCFVPKQV